MKPGKELDCLILEKVFEYTKQLILANSLPNTDCPGHTWPRQDGYVYINKGGYYDYFIGHVNDVMTHTTRGFKETLSYPPAYSEDPEAAFAVLEKMCERGFNWCMAGLNDGRFSCGFTEGGKLEYQSPYYKTFPEAICNEALRILNALP